MKWLTAEGSRRAHALRESSPRIGVPSVRMSMCGRIAWYRTATDAPEDMPRCAGCFTAILRRATL